MNKFKITAAMCLMFGLAGCKQLVPIENVNHQAMPDNVRQMSMKDVGENISSTLSGRGYLCNKVASNKLICTTEARKHKATVAIEYSLKDFSIQHVSTQNLKESDGEIHPKYNQWVANIKKDILQAMTNN